MKKIIRKTAAVLTAAAMTAAAMLPAGAEKKLSVSPVSVSYNASVSKPTFKVQGSTGYRKIKLTSSTSNAVIYYTTDGSTPTNRSKRYTDKIRITKTTKIKAIAYSGSSASSVMTKTFRVSTMPGDVTGDGSVTENDYKRLEKYLLGKTSFICKDNSDVTGNGKINSTDLKYIRQYLDGDIDEFPLKGGSSGGSSGGSGTSSSSVKKPTITVYKTFGGLKFDIQAQTSGSTIYYTTDGSDPTDRGIKYTGAFVVDKDTLVKAAAYKNGSYSSVKTRSVEVDPCANPSADMPDNKTYDDTVKVTLTCPTAGAKIYYTTNGADPKTSGLLYSGKLEFGSNTTLKVIAVAKGYAYSQTVTYNYKVQNTSFSISGTVWDDTYTANSKPDGFFQNTERGINGITVKLLNVSTNQVEQTVTTTTINGVAGSYVLDKAKANNSYKVKFEFNGMKYRPYSTIVNGGNQALGSTPNEITVKNSGAYVANQSTPIASVNSYSAATVSTSFTMEAITSSTYTSSTANVNLALASNIYGDLNLKISGARVTGSNGSTSNALSGQQVFGGDTITYYLDVKNDSVSTKLNSAVVYLYLNQYLELQNITSTSGYSTGNSYLSTDGLGMQKYAINVSALNAATTLTYNITVRVKPNIPDKTTLTCLAEVAEYTFAGSCFDYDSIPGNLSNYIERETDETCSLVLYGYSDLAASQEIKWDSINDYITPINVGNSMNYYFTVTNCSSIDDLVVDCSNDSLAIVQIFGAPNGKNLDCVLSVTGISTGSGTVTITIRKDASKYIRMSFTVI